jgi:signal transduction histidine kinase
MMSKLFNINFNDTIEQIKEKLLYAVLLLISVLGIPLIIMAGIEAYLLHQFSMLLVYLFFFVPVVGVTIFRKQLAYKFIAFVVISFGQLVAISNLVVYGFSGAGIPILFCMFVLSTIFFNQKVGLFMILVSTIALSIIGFLYITHRLVLGVSLDAISIQPIAWIMAFLVLVFLGVLIVLSYGLIQSKMLQSVELAQQTTHQLRNTNIQLSNDIKSRIQTELELKKSEALLLEAHRIAKLGTWEYNILNAEFKMSKMCYSILEIDESVLTHQLIKTIEKQFNKQEWEKAVSTITEVLKKNDSYTYDYKIVINTTEKFLRNSGKALFDDSGNLIGYAGIIQDLSLLKQSEEKIIKLNEELEQRILERTLESEQKSAELERQSKSLNDSQKALLNIVEDLNEKSVLLEESAIKLEASNKELESFSYSVAHDLRAPLRAIDGFSKFLYEDYHKMLDDEGKRLIDIIRENTKRMDQLINDLLQLSRITRNQLNLSLVDMKELAETVYKEIFQQAEDKSYTLEVEEMPKVYADINLIKQVWTNLIGNAVKYSMNKKKKKIIISAKTTNKITTFYVKDNGVGFDATYKHKLFGVFQRLHSLEEFEGTGVGLAIVKRIIDKHGGVVSADSELNKGATFSFSINAKKQ